MSVTGPVGGARDEESASGVRGGGDRAEGDRIAGDLTGGHRTEAGPRTGFGLVQPWISTVLRLLLGGVFVAAGAIKVVDLQASVQVVAAYRMLPGPLTTPVGYGLPFVEIALGLLLIAGLCTRAMAAVAAATVLVFVVAVLAAAARGLSVDCGCFGGGGDVAPGDTRYGLELVRDLALLATALWLLRFPRSRLGLQSHELLHL